MAKILAMNNILDLIKTPKDVNNDIVKEEGKKKGAEVNTG